jgi:uncharacterized protein (TIGR03435 family)
MPKYFLYLFAAVALAQTPMVFEVASIKPAGALDPAAIQSGKMRVGMKVDGAICDIGSFSLKDLIRTAYEVKDYQISGADGLGNAMTAQRFNIQATMPAGATEKDVPQMLQALLAERFKLVIHRDSKEHSVYALVVAKGGPKLKEAEPEPAAPPVDPEAAPPEPKKGETVMGQGSSQVRITGNMADGKGMTIKGGKQGKMHMAMVDGKMRMEADSMTMSGLAEVLNPFLDRPVVDMTELKGNYRTVLELSMDDLKNVARAAGMVAGGGGGGEATATAASDPAGTSIFVSIQQMGLKLEPRKAPVSMIVIDHMEKAPTDN